MNTRGKKIWADLRARWGRTLLASLSIMSGVFCVALLTGAGDIFLRQLAADTPPGQIAMLKQYVVLTEGPPLSLEDNRAELARLAALPGVQILEGQAFYPADWQKADGPGGSYESGNILAYTSDFGAIQLEPPHLLAGRYPQARRYELAVEVRFAEKHGLGLGDQLRFRPHQEGQAERAWTVVGILHHPFFNVSTARNENLDADANLYAAFPDAQALTGFAGLSSIYVRYADFPAAQANLDFFSGQVVAQSSYTPLFSFMEDPADPFLLRQIRQVTGVLDTLGLLALLVSGLVVINVINAMVTEQKGQIGIMKAIGAGRADTLFIYGGMAALYGLMGTGLALLLALPATSAFSHALAEDTLTYLEGFQYSPRGLLTGALLGLLVPILVAFLPVWNGTRISILEAINDRGIMSSWGQGPGARLIDGLPLPLGLLQSLRNIAQKRGRLALTGLTLVLAAGAFMGVTAVLSGVNDQIAAYYANTSYEIRINPQQGKTPADLQALLGNDPDIRGIYPGSGISGGLEGYQAPDGDIRAGTNQIFIAGQDPTAPIFHFPLVAGQSLAENPAGTVISTALAESLGVSVGDSLRLNITGQAIERQITGIQEMSSDEIFIEWQTLARLAGYVNRDGQPLANRFFVDLQQEGLSVAAVEAKIAQLRADLEAAGLEASYQNQPENAANQANNLNIFTLIFYIMTALMATVGALGLLAALSMAVFERQKEIGVMRSLGASSGAIWGHFLLEGLVISVLAWAIALPISYLIGYSLLHSLPIQGVVFHYPPLAALYGLAGSISLGAVASFYPAWAASRKTVSQILRYQ